ncbi:MAG: hypothetical protein LBS09_04510 [Bacteroidales bacterium]|jgi:hypothetical protein|nr:hypothetical protein [Bacteroidales bacterium]
MTLQACRHQPQKEAGKPVVIDIENAISVEGFTFLPVIVNRRQELACTFQAVDMKERRRQPRCDDRKINGNSDLFSLCAVKNIFRVWESGIFMLSLPRVFLGKNEDFVNHSKRLCFVTFDCSLPL